MRDYLEKYIRAAYPEQAYIDLAGSHSSKSNSLPILSARGAGPVEVLNFSYNYYFHFLGMHLREPMSAMVAFPISNTFGSYALSGHTDNRRCPPIRSFERLYYRRENLPTQFGLDVGTGTSAAIVLRYLVEAQKLNMKEVLRVALHQMPYGRGDLTAAREDIDANDIDFEALVKAMGFHGESKSYDFVVSAGNQSTFSSIVIDQFDTLFGGSRVNFELNEGRYLPSMSLPRGALLVDPNYSALGDRIPNVGSERYRDGIVTELVPAQIFQFNQDKRKEFYEIEETLPYDLNGVYSVIGSKAKKFAIHCPNVLDAVMTAYFLTYAVGPVVDALAETTLLLPS